MAQRRTIWIAAIVLVVLVTALVIVMFTFPYYSPDKPAIRARMMERYSLSLAQEFEPHLDQQYQIIDGQSREELRSLLKISEFEYEQELVQGSEWSIHYWSRGGEFAPQIDEFAIHDHELDDEHAHHHDEKEFSSKSLTYNIIQSEPDRNQVVVIEQDGVYRAMTFEIIADLIGFDTQESMHDAIMINHKLLQKNSDPVFRGSKVIQVPLLFDQSYPFSSELNSHGFQYCDRVVFTNLKAQYKPILGQVEYYAHGSQTIQNDSIVRVILKRKNDNIIEEVQPQLVCTDQEIVC